MRRFALASPVVVPFLTLLLALAPLPAASADGDAEAPRLAIGDAAPDVDIAHWVKGVEMDRRGAFTPVTTWEPGRIYLLEFWATWCPPCVGSMPHLSELQARYAEQGVRVIGVSDESLPKVVAFLFTTYERDGKLQDDRTHYTLTTDPDRSTHDAFFKAAGRTGIPCGFLIGPTGQIEWIGHPMTVDEPLAALVAGTWDREAFKATYEEERRVDDVRRAFQTAKRAKDWATCWRLLEEQGADLPNLDMERATVLLCGLDRPDEGCAVLADLVHRKRDDARTLNQIAWWIVDTQGLARRDLDLALGAAERAVELTKGEDAAILDTLARVHHDRGDLARAIEIQRQAVERAGDDRLGEGIRKVLAGYEAEEAGAAPE